MDTEKILSPQESLTVIADTITRTKENIRENSFCFLLWGWLIAAASFMEYFLHHFTTIRFYFIPFPVLAATGIITTIIYFKRKNNSSSLTYIMYFINKMWIVLGICFIMVVFINVSQGKLPFTYTLLIAGIGTLVSGWVMKFRPLITGGILFLIATILSIYLAYEYQPLLNGFAVIAGYLIPGYFLKNSKD
jgi:hypothetical protein